VSDTQRAAPDASGVPFAGIADHAARARVRPGEALFEESESARALPVCDHYCGVEARMRKSLELQAELGPVFDITLDGEDGAPVGGERDHALLMSELVNSPHNRFGRVGVRVMPVDHPADTSRLGNLSPCEMDAAITWSIEAPAAKPAFPPFVLKLPGSNCWPVSTPAMPRACGWPLPMLVIERSRPSTKTSRS